MPNISALLGKLVEYPDRRIKAIIYTMASSGIIVRAWDYLQWKHITPLHNDSEVVAAKLLIYPGEQEEYYTFITLEAYNALQVSKTGLIKYTMRYIMYFSIM
jgi:hypothetical protein